MKTGNTLQKIVGDAEANKLQDIMDQDGNTFEEIKNRVKDRASSVDDALQQTAEVKKLFKLIIIIIIKIIKN